VIISVEFILTPPAKLELAKRTFHELAPARPLDQHLTARAFLSNKTLVQITQQTQILELIPPRLSAICTLIPLVVTRSALVRIRAPIIREAYVVAFRIRARYKPVR
jgi:hypothetical protein